MADITITIHDNFTPKIASILVSEKPRMEHALANQVMKDTNKYVPALTLTFANMAQVVGNRIIYRGPQARYLYYGKVMVDAATGKGPMRIVGKDGSEIIRFRKGARLKPTERPIKYTKSVHPQATDHWIEASKIHNMKKWGKFTERMVIRAINSG